MAAVEAGLARELAERPASAEAFGVLLAEAAVEAWGSGWLDRAGMPLVTPGPILTAANRSGTPPPEAPEPGGGDVADGTQTMVTRAVEAEPQSPEPQPSEPQLAPALEELIETMDPRGLPVASEGTSVVLITAGEAVDGADDVVSQHGGRRAGAAGEASAFGFPTVLGAVQAATQLAGAGSADGSWRFGLHGSVAAADDEARARLGRMAVGVAAAAEEREVVVSASVRGMAGGSPGVVFLEERAVRLPPDGLPHPRERAAHRRQPPFLTPPDIRAGLSYPG